MKVLLLLTAILFSISSQAQRIIVEYQGVSIVLETKGLSYSVGSTIEITRSQWGNTSNITPWSINHSPILGKSEMYAERKDLAKCKDCTLGYVVMTHVYAKVKVKKIVQ